MARVPVIALGLAAMLASAAAHAADAARGAQLYMRVDDETRSCVSCHGPDPGLSHNNILRAADSPQTLAKVLNTVSQMGFLRSRLSDADHADVAAFLGTVSRLNAAGAPLQVWPLTMDFGAVQVGGTSAMQALRLSNPSAAARLPLGSITVVGGPAQLSHDCPGELAPGAACEVQVRLRPAAPGLARAAVEVVSSALATPVYVGVSGTGAAQPPSMLAWREAGGLRFGEQQRRTLVLANPGPMPAVLGLASIVGPHASLFSLEGGCAQGAVVVAGTSCEMTVVYRPSQSPAAQAVLQLRSDQANPPSVALEAIAAQPDAQAAPPVAGASGGGCSVGPPDRRTVDPLLLLLALLAAASLARRKARGRPAAG